jgi:hypothetical protein
LVPILTFGQSSPPTQTDQQSLIWLQGFSTVKLDSKSRWSFPLEIQIRRAETGATWQQFQFRGTVLFKANDRVSLGGGYSYINTWPYGAQPVATEFPEHRLYEQLSINHKSLPKEHRFDHRLRLEQRYVRRINNATRQLLDEYNYTNRFRYQGGITVPLNKGGDPWHQKKDDWIFYANNELFFNFGENVQRNKFDQNRVAAGIGYYLSPNSNFRVGYLHQYIQKGDGVRFDSNHIITLGLTYNFTLR